jgi:hypothetical protein
MVSHFNWIGLLLFAMAYQLLPLLVLIDFLHKRFGRLAPLIIHPTPSFSTSFTIRVVRVESSVYLSSRSLLCDGFCKKIKRHVEGAFCASRVSILDYMCEFPAVSKPKHFILSEQHSSRKSEVDSFCKVQAV